MEFSYTVKRSPRRKKVTITVERDRSIVVLAPENATDEKIQNIVDSKRMWIYEKIRHPQKFSPKPHGPGKELVNGESFYYFGRQYQVELSEDLSEEVIFDQRFYFPRYESEKVSNKDLLREWYINRAKEKIVPRVAKYANALGVKVENVKIVDNRYRWGSCTINNNINISWLLIKAPMFVVDYVIVHELAHLIESNHTPIFWNIVRAQLPKMEKAKLWLKENGELLQAEWY